LDTQFAHFGKLDGVVRSRVDGFTEVQPNFGRVNVEGGHKLNVTYVVTTEVNVHKPRYIFRSIGVAVILNALNQAAGAVSYSGDGNAYAVVFV
jgi:hypothetical protein